MKLKWAFGFPGGTTAYGAPTAAGGRVFVGSDNGFVYSLDLSSGCVYWSFEAKAGVRTAVNVGPVSGIGNARYAAYFADLSANVYGVNAETGELLWTVKADPHPTARVTGSMILYENLLYVPVASWEELSGAVPDYSCCTFRGSVVALNTKSGKETWKSYGIEETPTAYRRNSRGIAQFRPAGAGVWVTPALDPRRNALYVATGDAYTSPATDSSDAVIAFDLKTGKRLWKYQAITNDGWVIGCDPEIVKDRPENCPDRDQQNTKYHDVDFVGAVVLKTLQNGQRLIMAMNQAGIIYALDPDRNGTLVWQYSAEPGVYNFGGAVDNQNVYGPIGIRDASRDTTPKTITGLASGGTGALDAVSLATGKRVWRTPAPLGHCEDKAARSCGSSQAAAPTVVPGLVFSGARDGLIRAYSTDDGHIVWEFDTKREFETVNKVSARGGTLDGAGPVVADGMLLMGSGYSLFAGVPGNVLLAFGVE